MKYKQAKWLAAIGLSLAITFLTPAIAFLQGPGVSVSVGSVNPKAFPEIEAIVAVLDANGLIVPNLQPANFTILEDSRPVTVKSASTFLNPDAPIATCLAIDISGSMVGQPIENAKAAAKAFVDSLGAKDQACIVAFGEQIDTNPASLNPARELNFTSDKNLLKNLIDQLSPDTKAGTPLYDAALKAIKMTATQPPGTRAVILFTDGKDEKLDSATNQVLPGSISTADRPISAAKDARIPVFTIGLGSEIDARYLQQLAEQTGGTYQKTESPTDLTGFYQAISNQLKTQYSVKYTSSLFPDGKDHALQVRVKTAAGETETRATLALPRDVVTKPFLRLYYKEGDQQIDLTDGQKLRGTVTIAPQIATAGIISFTVFVVDNTPVFTSTVAPWTFDWDTSKQQPYGLHQLTVRAQDDKGQVGETVVRVETVPAPTPIETIVGLPMEVKVGAVVGILVLIGLVILVVARTRSTPKMCPRGLHTMPPGATVCPFCAEEDRLAMATQAPPPYPASSLPPTPFAPPPPPPLGETQVLSGSGSAAGPRPMDTVSLQRKPMTVAFLVMEAGTHVGKEFTLHSTDTSIGRAGTNDIVVDDATVGRQQAKIKFEGKEAYLYDLAATNPTLVNDKPVRGRRKLDENDRIKMGNAVFVFKQVKGV